MTGFYPSGGLSCTLKNVIYSSFENAFNANLCNYDGVKMLLGSRVWQISNGTTNLIARGVYTESCYAVLLMSASGSTFTVIDSILSTPVMTANSSSEGFLLKDQFSCNLGVVDSSTGDVIDGASVVLLDRSGVAVIDETTDLSGLVPEQYVTRVLYVSTAGTGAGKYTTNDQNPFTLTVSCIGYETYVEIFTYPLSVPLAKTVALKPAIEAVMTNKGIGFKPDPTNIIDRDILFIP